MGLKPGHYCRSCAAGAPARGDYGVPAVAAPGVLGALVAEYSAGHAA